MGNYLQDAPLTASLGGGILLCALLLRIAPDLETVFFLVPGATVTRPWQVLTAGYFEDSGLGLCIGLASLAGVGALLRSAWGERELCKYLVLVSAASGCMTWVGMIVLYILFRSEHFLFAQLGGLSGLLGALAVAAKQHSLRRARGAAVGALPLPASLAPPGSPLPAVLESAMAHAPLLSLGWTLLLLLLTHSGPPDELLLCVYGLLCGWFYLRYFQPGSDGACGDASAEFALASLAPRPLQPPLRVLGQATYLVVTSTGAFPPSGYGIHDAGTLSTAVELVGGGVHGTPRAATHNVSSLGGGAGGGGGGAGGGTYAAAPPLPSELSEQLSTPIAGVTTSDQAVAERRRERARVLIEARLANATQRTSDLHAATPVAADDTALPATPATGGEDM